MQSNKLFLQVQQGYAQFEAACSDAVAHELHYYPTIIAAFTAAAAGNSVSSSVATISEGINRCRSVRDVIALIRTACHSPMQSSVAIIAAINKDGGVGLESHIPDRVLALELVLRQSTGLTGNLMTQNEAFLHAAALLQAEVQALSTQLSDPMASALAVSLQYRTNMTREQNVELLRAEVEKLDEAHHHFRQLLGGGGGERRREFKRDRIGDTRATIAFNDLRQQQYEPRAPPLCYNCRERGHVAKYCPMPPTTPRQPPAQRARTMSSSGGARGPPRAALAPSSGVAVVLLPTENSSTSSEHEFETDYKVRIANGAPIVARVTDMIGPT